MKSHTAQVVVVTGASAGVGRAIVREFAKRGAHIGLLARGHEGLEGTRKDVETCGGKALAIPTDVASFEQVEAAAARVEEAFGPIDLWINVAMASVFSPFKDMQAEDFKRVTEVTYLGQVYGTMAALKRMLPRDRGRIIQVGSALAYRGIPLQSAYCGSKHAIQGFTESVRCELIHDKSNVKISMVQLPAVNTPQFGWVKNHLPNKAQPVPPHLSAGSRCRRRHLGRGPLPPPALHRVVYRHGYSSQQNRDKAYRWGEDGLAGVSDRHQQLCFALALWNGRDPILKERLFGLSNFEGNHGEDVKEYYYYLDNTPTHSYMRFLYKYPHAEYPYTHLVEANGRRGRTEPEYELIDTGILDAERYFDLFVEYAKASPEDLLIGLTIANRGPEEAMLDLLPTLWFRNTWSWQFNSPRPSLRRSDDHASASQMVIVQVEGYGGRRWFYSEGTPSLLFTENETNTQRLYGTPNVTPYVKDGIHNYIVHGKQDAVNPAQSGTKVAVHYHLTLAAGETRTVHLRLSEQPPQDLHPFDQHVTQIFQQRQQEADEFYAAVIRADLSDDAKLVQRQALAGILWNKQFYYYDVRTWLQGDPAQPSPPPERRSGRNHNWLHLHNEDVLSMPDKWEYPWYASWDLAFQCVVLAQIDGALAEEQLLLLLREWYMHANGQLPADEWNFNAANPPVHSWAAYRVYKIEEQQTGKGNRDFLEKVFQKLLLNFTWWVNRKDYAGKDVFQGGVLGLDNIGVFDRNQPLSDGGRLEQSDGTSWMAMYCLHMLTIALELAQEDRVYSDIASKFFEHFLSIAHAMNQKQPADLNLWDEQDGFYYDVLHTENQTRIPLKVRSMVGLIPLFAIAILDSQLIDRLPVFKQRLHWYLDNWGDISQHLERRGEPGQDERILLSLVNRQRLPRLLKFVFDEVEFLSPYGVRSLSRYHLEHPFVFQFNRTRHSVNYEPAESTMEMFGGNSNWRGPIWFPLNYLMIESLKTFARFYGETFTVAFPTGSASQCSLEDIAAELSRRLTRIFLRDEHGRRAVYGGVERFQHHPHWRDLVLFYEYFHGDDGAGLGASHQTGWTGLLANLFQENGG